VHPCYSVRHILRTTCTNFLYLLCIQPPFVLLQYRGCNILYHVQLILLYRHHNSRFCSILARLLHIINYVRILNSPHVQVQMWCLWLIIEECSQIYPVKITRLFHMLKQKKTPKLLNKRESHMSTQLSCLLH